jgi:hypothetical protein
MLSWSCVRHRPLSSQFPITVRGGALTLKGSHRMGAGQFAETPRTTFRMRPVSARSISLDSTLMFKNSQVEENYCIHVLWFTDAKDVESTLWSGEFSEVNKTLWADCRDCWYIQSCWYFRPSFVNCCPSPFLSGLTLPTLPRLFREKVYGTV